MAEATTTVGYKGRQWHVPSDVMSAMAQNENAAAEWIEDQIAEEMLRITNTKQQKEATIEKEFVLVKDRLNDLESKEIVIRNLERQNKSLTATVEALSSQISALESSGSAAGSASADARQTAYELSLASTNAQNTLATLQDRDLVMTQRFNQLQAQLNQLTDQFDQRLSDAQQAGAAQSQMMQQACNAALKQAAEAEERASKAEAVAAQALRDAEAAQIIGRDQITQARVQDMIEAEVREVSPQLVNDAIDVIRQDEFQGGSVTGQRYDPKRTQQTRKDAAAIFANEA